MRLRITAPAQNLRGPLYMQKALAAIHQSLKPGQAFSLTYRHDPQGTSLGLDADESLIDAVTAPLTANYPECGIAPVELEEQRGVSYWLTLTLVPELMPTLRHSQFEDQLNRTYADPIDVILQALAADGDDVTQIMLLLTPAAPARIRAARLAVERLSRPFFRRHPILAEFYARTITRPWKWLLAWLLGLLAASEASERGHILETSSSQRHEREEDLQAAAEKLGHHLFEAQLRLQIRAERASSGNIGQRLQTLSGAFGSFTRSRLAHFSPSRVVLRHRPPVSPPFLLSHEEVATLWHPPTAAVSDPVLAKVPFRELPPPARCYSGEERGAVVLGRARFRGDGRTIGVGLDDRRRHTYLIGRTGTGKTTALLNFILGDIQAGRGVGLIDVHGDLADQVLRRIPAHRTQEVIVLDPSDETAPVPFNPLACPNPKRLDQVAAGVAAAFRRIHDSWGPRLQDTLANAAHVVAEQGGNLLTLLRFLTEEALRIQLVARVTDDLVRSFWQHDFAGWSKAYRTEAVAAITNKLRPALLSRHLRGVFGAPGKSLDLRRVLDEGRVLIARASKGLLGEDNATLFGALLVTSVQQAAMSRADVPEESRRDWCLYVDEFQNFVTSSIDTILSEARKYRLLLTVAHQFLGQLRPETAQAILANVGTILCFGIGSEDAAILAPALSKFPGQLSPQDLTNLPRYTAYARVLIEGLPSDPFSLATLAPAPIVDDRSDIVLRTSRRLHGRTITALDGKVLPINPSPT